jgi:hypothetical protein
MCCFFFVVLLLAVLFLTSFPEAEEASLLGWVSHNSLEKLFSDSKRKKKS